MSSTAVKNAKAGQVQFRTDKGGIIHATIGKADFDVDALKGNLHALVTELVKIKPPAAKGQYLRKIAVSTTMGPGLTVDTGSLGPETEGVQGSGFQVSGKNKEKDRRKADGAGKGLRWLRSTPDP
jgi:hypothetical protein